MWRIYHWCLHRCTVSTFLQDPYKRGRWTTQIKLRCHFFSYVQPIKSSMYIYKWLIIIVSITFGASHVNVMVPSIPISDPTRCFSIWVKYQRYTLSNKMHIKVTDFARVKNNHITMLPSPGFKRQSSPPVQSDSISNKQMFLSFQSLWIRVAMLMLRTKPEKG